MSLRLMKRIFEINFTCAYYKVISHNYQPLIKCNSSLIIFCPFVALRIPSLTKDPSLPKDVMLFKIQWGFLFCFCFCFLSLAQLLSTLGSDRNRKLRQSCTCLLTQTTLGLEPVEAEVVAKVRWDSGRGPSQGSYANVIK